MRYARLTLLVLAERRRRLLALLAAAGVFLAAALGTSILARDPHGGFDMDALFQVGGYPLVSSALLTGWLLGRYPLLAVLVLTAGLVSGDRAAGVARLYAVRPGWLPAIYAGRALLLWLVAFALSAVLLPGFDLLLLGGWAGPGTLVLIAAYILVYGGLTFALSAWTRGDGWIAAGLALVAIVWHALLRAGALEAVAPGGRRFLTMVLPPHGALFALEGAFAGVLPIPWAAFGYCAAYGGILLLLGCISLSVREH